MSAGMHERFEATELPVQVAYALARQDPGPYATQSIQTACAQYREQCQRLWLAHEADTEQKRMDVLERALFSPEYDPTVRQALMHCCPDEERAKAWVRIGYSAYCRRRVGGRV